MCGGEPPRRARSTTGFGSDAPDRNPARDRTPGARATMAVLEGTAIVVVRRIVAGDAAVQAAAALRRDRRRSFVPPARRPPATAAPDNPWSSSSTQPAADLVLQQHTGDGSSSVGAATRTSSARRALIAERGNARRAGPPAPSGQGAPEAEPVLLSTTHAMYVPWPNQRITRRCSASIHRSDLQPSHGGEGVRVKWWCDYCASDCPCLD